MQPDDIEQRLVRWGAAVSSGDGSGYPTVSVLHPSWTPPSPGVMPTLKAAPHSDVAGTHRAIGRLSLKRRNAVVMCYAMRLSIDEQCARLGCTDRVRRLRLASARLQLLAELQSSFCNIPEFC